MNILITSGPTRAPLDAMRYLSNRSTGRFGTLLAEEALRKGARVTFIYGKGSQIPKPHRRLKLVEVETNAEVSDTLRRLLRRGRFGAVIHAMAVLDFQASKVRVGKTATRKGLWRLTLKPTPKIISSIKKWAPRTVLVGFKLEVGISKRELFRRARRLLRESNADYILANQLTEGPDTKHAGFLLDKKGRLIGKSQGKENLAKLIIRNIEALLNSKFQAPISK